IPKNSSASWSLNCPTPSSDSSPARRRFPRDPMGTSRDARGFLRRLEDRIEELVSRDDRVSLAFSGGLTSTLLATVARKRCDLICLVAGTPASPDVRASNAAKQHFDFRVESVLLDREIVRRNLQEMRALNRTMSMNSLQTLTPIYAVVD